ncbi:MAG: sulfatase modifying factor 1 [Porticoccaceae bacterium]|jgi:sulfatase modifying factor 1|nr:formylglycine-generating enzyme family protein [Porticoccaceae bacterium]|tara:strand:- start:851 stop:1843 length:993 start_codon:yes stop_codon:yes gene_type:complete
MHKPSVRIYVGVFCLALLTACSEDKLPLACLPESELNQTVDVSGGDFKFGDNRYYPNEGPVKVTRVADFNIDKTEVTNGQFKAFVDATDYVTAAERGLSDVDFPEIPPEFRVPGSMVFVAPDLDKPSSPATWWQFVSGANWQNPKGPDSSIAGKEAHPVVQVTHADAIAYAQWLGRRLPTEAEWEYASRGGLEGASFSWGEESPNVGASKANTWQGRFPYNNMNEDGFVGSSPVGCFAANGLGLYDTTGNVWEWTDTAYGPDRKRDYGAEGYDPQQPGVTVKTLKGGSFLCSDNYCQRFRPAARQAQDTTLASSHIGFRTAADINTYLDL